MAMMTSLWCILAHRRMHKLANIQWVGLTRLQERWRCRVCRREWRHVRELRRR